MQHCACCLGSARDERPGHGRSLPAWPGEGARRCQKGLPPLARGAATLIMERCGQRSRSGSDARGTHPPARARRSRSARACRGVDRWAGDARRFSTGADHARPPPQAVSPLAPARGRSDPGHRDATGRRRARDPAHRVELRVLVRVGPARRPSGRRRPGPRHTGSGDGRRGRRRVEPAPALRCCSPPTSCTSSR